MDRDRGRTPAARGPYIQKRVMRLRMIWEKEHMNLQVVAALWKLASRLLSRK